MPTSTPIFKEQTKEYILKYIDKSANIIDIGAGVGTYADMLRPLGYDNIDAVEVFNQYIENYHLKSKYRSVFNHNIINSELYLNDYSLAILGDVVEHMTYRDSLIVLDKLKLCKEIIIAVPFNAIQGPSMGNQYEIHIQNDLTNEKFLSMYEEFIPLCLRYDYGVYVKNTNDNNQENLYVVDLPDEEISKLTEQYSHRKIVNLNKEAE
jgi:hypothetical protein